MDNASASNTYYASLLGSYDKSYIPDEQTQQSADMICRRKPYGLKCRYVNYYNGMPIAVPMIEETPQQEAQEAQQEQQELIQNATPSDIDNAMENAANATNAEESKEAFMKTLKSKKWIRNNPILMKKSKRY